MALIEYWIQIENRKWDASPANIDRMTGQTMAKAVNFAPVDVSLNTYVPGSMSRTVKMFNPIRRQGVAIDALILRRYKPPRKPDQSDAWTVPDDRKINPWDLNERNPTEDGTRGTIPGPTLELSVGDSLLVHFRNSDFRSGWDINGRTHSLHPHGVVFEARFDGAFPLSPPDPAQPVGTEAALWAAIGVNTSKKGDRVPPGGTFTYRWETFSWPSTAGVWLYHDHSVNDMDNVERGAIGMIVVHNSNDRQDVDIRDATSPDPTALDPKFLPGGSPNGSPVRVLPIITFPIGANSMAKPAPEPRESPSPLPIVADPAATRSPAPLAKERAVALSVTGELTPDLSGIHRLFLSSYRIPPTKLPIMQLYHTLEGIGFAINGRSYLGNTPTIVAGTKSKMRFGVVGMGSMFHTFHLHGHRWILPGPHGTDPSTQQSSPMDTPVSQFEDTRTFGPANSFVFTTDEAAGSFMRAGGPLEQQALGEWHMHCHVLNHMMTGMMGSLLIVAGGEFAGPLPQGIPPGLGDEGGQATPLEVHLKGAKFLPEVLEVKMGDTVTWIWDEDDFHTVTSTSPGTPFQSAQMSTIGSTFSHTFTSMGDFPYWCEVHTTNMQGMIKVTM